MINITEKTKYKIVSIGSGCDIKLFMINPLLPHYQTEFFDFLWNFDGGLKTVKNIIKDYIGEEFYPYIEFNLHNVEEKKILWVKCKASDKPVWIKGEDFYVRSNPATDKLVGDKQYSYILARFETRK